MIPHIRTLCIHCCLNFSFLLEILYLSAMWETQVDPWVRRIPWRRAWPPTPVFLAWKIPWTEEPGGRQSMGSQRVRHDGAANTLTSSLFFSQSRERMRPLSFGKSSEAYGQGFLHTVFSGLNKSSRPWAFFLGHIFLPFYQPCHFLQEAPKTQLSET